MRPFKQLELPALIELLASQTEVLMKMLYAGLDTEEMFRRCEETIRQIQAEIQARKVSAGKQPSTTINGLNLPWISTRLS